MNMLNKKLVVILVLLAAILVALAVWIGMQFSKTNADGSRPSDYSAVMFTNGDVYFGKLSWFPSPKLTNVWVLQRSVDDQGQVQLGVTPLNRAFWAPVDEVNINFSQIISWTRLRKDSQLVLAMENPNSLQQFNNLGNGQDIRGSENAVPNSEINTSASSSPSGK